VAEFDALLVRAAFPSRGAIDKASARLNGFIAPVPAADEGIVLCPLPCWLPVTYHSGSDPAPRHFLAIADGAVFPGYPANGECRNDRRVLRVRPHNEARKATASAGPHPRSHLRWQHSHVDELPHMELDRRMPTSWRPRNLPASRTGLFRARIPRSVH
jgi:hypothetical protein